MKHLFSPADLERIERSVKEAEAKTSAEIVPMIVKSSSPCGHVPLMLLLIHLLLLWTLVPYLAPLFPEVPVWLVELVALGLAGVLSWAQKDFAFWKRRLVSLADQEASVMRRAQLEFYQSNIKATEGKTGVLIFVSLLERRAVILADHAVSEKFPPNTWAEIVQGLVTRVRAGTLAEGFTFAVEAVGEKLADKFPVAHKDVNELPDMLIIKE